MSNDAKPNPLFQIAKGTLEDMKKTRQHLLTGVSHAIPFVASGGILIALAIAFTPMGNKDPNAEAAPNAEVVQELAETASTPMDAEGLDTGTAPNAEVGESAPTPVDGESAEAHAASNVKVILKIGETAFALLLPILAGYIAFAIASRPGLVPGFVGGYLAGEIKAGFLGAIIIGLLAGWLVNIIKRIPIPSVIRPIMPILIIPIVSSAIIGFLMLHWVGPPIADLMGWLGEWLADLSTGNAVVLAMVLGAMIAFDMGGPVNKAAFFFGAALIKENQFAVMGACAAAICTPPLGLGLATLLRRKLWREEERDAGYAALAMGMMGITEGAIPFAAADPFRVIPCIMIGSMAASVTAMLGGVGDHAPHGGPIVLPVVDEQLNYIIAIIVGMIVTAVAINLLKAFSQKRAAEAKESA